MAILAASLVVLAARPAAAGSVVSAKGLLCGGTGPQAGSISVARSTTDLALKFKAKDLTPFQSVRCGYFCAFAGTNVDVVCGMVSESGRWSHSLELPAATCWGFLPFFNTGTTGSCLSGIVP